MPSSSPSYRDKNPTGGLSFPPRFGRGIIPTGRESHCLDGMAVGDKEEGGGSHIQANLISSNLQHIAPTPPPETAQSATNSWMTSNRQQAGREAAPPSPGSPG